MTETNFTPGNRHNNFTQIYLRYANEVISDFVAQDMPEKISRRKIELQILDAMEKMEFPIEFRLAYFSMVAHTDVFDIYWMGIRQSHGLSKSSVARVKPDYDMIFNLPPLNPPDSPDGSVTSSSVESVVLGVDYGFQDAIEHIDTLGELDVGESAAARAPPASVPPVPRPFTVPPASLQAEQAGDAPPAKKKRTPRKQPTKPKAAPKRRAPPAQKAPRNLSTAKVVDGDLDDAETANPGTQGAGGNDEDDGADHAPKPGQTGGKSVPPSQSTGVKRPPSTEGKKKGRPKKAVRFNIPDEESK